ncbi:MAG: hypothetical protein AAFW67_13920, partial [Cyanobacteria bacterium J06638_38]
MTILYCAEILNHLISYMKLVKSQNLFIDTESQQHYNQNGDVQVQFTNPLHCRPNEMFRLSLVNFSMYKNFYNINGTNNKLQLTANPSWMTQRGFSAPQTITLDHKDYFSIKDVADELAAKLANITGGTVSVTSPASQVSPGNTTDKILRLRFTPDIPGLSITPVNDSKALLGAPFKITHSVGQHTDLEGGSVMQRSTAEHLYLRTDLLSDGYHSSSYDSST